MKLTPEEAMLIEEFREIDVESRESIYISAMQEFKDAKKAGRSGKTRM